MKDFITIEFQSTCKQDEVIAVLKAHLPDFQWRCGDSDMQGLYVSGRNSDLVNIQFWLSEPPMSATISFRNSWLDIASRDTLKKEILNKVVIDTIPVLGKLLNQTAD
jgi:hypothetical protein